MKMNRRNKSINDLEFIEAWAMIVLSFLIEKSTNKAYLNNQIDKAKKIFKEKNNAKIKLLFRSVYTLAITSNEEVRVELNKILKGRFDKELEEVKPLPIKTKNLSDSQFAELTFMKDWCITVLEYTASKFPDDFVYTHNRTYGDFFRQKIAVVNGSFQANNLKGMKMIYNDMNENARDLQNDDKLNKILLEKFGKSMHDEWLITKKKIKNIILRGEIRNDEEFYLANSYLSDFVNVADEDAHILDNLLGFFEEKHKKQL